MRTQCFIGVDDKGVVRYQLPPGFTHKDSKDFLKPGGPRAREELVQIVIANAVDAKEVANEKDFQNYTALHYAAMWGWVVAIT